MIITNAREMLKEILRFLKKDFSYLFQWAEREESFRNAMVQTAMDFIERKEKDFVNYSWEEKIMEKRRELYGF